MTGPVLHCPHCGARHDESNRMRPEGVPDTNAALVLCFECVRPYMAVSGPLGWFARELTPGESVDFQEAVRQLKGTL